MAVPSFRLLLVAPLVLSARPVAGQIPAFPFASEIVAAKSAPRIAWVLVNRGVRNIYVAEAPQYAPRQVTSFTEDDGLELTSLSMPANGKVVVFTRGGDHGSNWGGEGGHQPDPSSSPDEPHVEIYSVPFEGGAPKLIARGDGPVVSPAGDRVAYLADGGIVIAPLGGNDSTRHVYAKGNSGSLQWSPSGDRLAFVSDRGDHAFIGVYQGPGKPITWIAPTSNRDFDPRWSPDGANLAFVRISGAGGPPPSMLGPHPSAFEVQSPLLSFEIWAGDSRSGQAHKVWSSPAGDKGALPSTDGGPNLHYMSGDRITFLSHVDGWEHLYSVPASGGTPLLLTPGKFMTEYISTSPDGKFLVYSANTGSHPGDLDRRHLFSVPVDAAHPTELTPGEGIEWTPVVTGDLKSVAFIGATVQQPMLPAVVPVGGGSPTRLNTETLPSDWMGQSFVTPKAVTFRASDGVEVHAQLFQAPGTGRRPAVVFVHGGPPRQMLLGWHYMYYYSNAYALNQYLASKGFVVLSVNYRLGIGYGHEFHHPANAGMLGASEYRDVVASARYLRGLANVDSARIGIWGGSYGGFLVAMALARNSDLFATGVDLHGVHDWIADWGPDLLHRDRYEQAADLQQGLALAWRSSPMSSVAGWKSPVLLIHGDDDRNVRFHQTVDLIQRLRAKGVRYEEMVLPDEIHDFLRYASWIRADSATVAWLTKELKP